jgi:prepilin-type N-terminal cleavage/methylation domain-containing protein
MQRMHTPSHQSRAGYTLIEMILVIAILLLLGGMSAFIYSRFYLVNAVSNSAEIVIFSMRKAQHYSMIGKQTGNWGVAFTGGAVLVFNGTSSATRNTTFDEVWDIPNTVSLSGFNETIFSRVTGLPSVTSTIVISAAGETKTVSVNGQGVVSQY